jgi:hypothetical protein
LRTLRRAPASISWLLAFVLVYAVAGAESLHAQRATSIERLGAVELPATPTSGIRLSGANTAFDAGRNAWLIRLLTAAGGTAVGFVVGGTVGYQVGSHDCGGCDDPGLDAFIYGALVGIPVGAALGAAAPRLGSVCPFSERAGRALLGAFAGGAVGLVAGFATEGAGGITIPVFSIAGALGSLGRCWKAEPQ